MPRPDRSLLAAALLTAGTAATLVPAAAQAQREQCRYMSRGRWYDCRVTTTTRVERTRRRHDDGMTAGRQLSLMVGALRYDRNGRETVPMGALRGDWRLTRHLRGELGVSYGFGDVPRLVGADAASVRTPGTGPVGAHLLESTVGLTAELPLPFVRPYVGVAGGLFGRFDEEGGGGFVRPAVAVPLGVRLHFSPRLALRAESRWRFDQHPSGASAPNAEFTAGLSVGY